MFYSCSNKDKKKGKTTTNTFACSLCLMIGNSSTLPNKRQTIAEHCNLIGCIDVAVFHFYYCQYTYKKENKWKKR